MESASFTKDNKTGEIIFKPNYDYRTYLATLIMPILFLLSLWIYQNDLKKDAGNIFFTAMFGIFTLLVLFIFIRKIQFGRQMVVKYFLYSRYVEYSDIKGINRMAIHLNGRGISLAAVENTEELIKAFPQLMKMPKTAFDTESPLTEQTKLISKSGKFAAVLATLFAIALNYFFKFNLEITFFILLFASWNIVYFILKENIK